MLFREWLLLEQNQITICVDLDNTLIHNTDDGICVRPGTEQFLDAVQKLGPVCIYTYGLTERQKKVTESVGISLPLIGRDRFGELEPNGNYILIDNRPPEYFHTVHKLESLGIGPDRLITVKTWYCGDGPDDELEKAYDKAKIFLFQNEWVEKDVKKDKQQPFKTYGKAKDLAKERKENFTKKLEASADGHEVVVNIKSKGSFEDKTEDRGKNPKKVFDVLRASILVDEEDQVDDVVARIKKNFEVKKIEHKTDPREDEFGYYGPTHVDVILDGMVCEIHVMTRQMWDYKFKAHDLYAKYRSVENPPKEVIKKTKKLYRKGNGDA